MIRKLGSDVIQQTTVQEADVEKASETKEVQELTENLTSNISDSRATEHAASVMSERALSAYVQQIYVSDSLEKGSKAGQIKDPIMEVIKKIGASEGKESSSQSAGVENASTPSPQGAASIQKTLKLGSKEPEVTTLQTDLNKWRAQNNLEAIPVNGTFDKETDAAVREFQAAKRLNVDGVVGRNTRDHLALENDPNFQKLSDTVKESVRVDMLKLKDDPQARKDLLELATRDEFVGCNSLRCQELALIKFSETHSLNDSYGLIGKRYALENDPNFQALSPKMKDRVDAEMAQCFLQDPKLRPGKEGTQLGLVRVVTAPGFGKLSEAQQEKVLENLRTNQLNGPNTSRLNPERVRDILEEPNFQNLDDATRTHVLELCGYYACDGKALMELNLVVSNPAFALMSPDQQNAALDTFKTVHWETRLDHE